jgi:hypothetical protein
LKCSFVHVVEKPQKTPLAYAKNVHMKIDFEHFEYDPHEAKFNRLCIQYDNAKTELELCGKQYERLSERCAQIKMELNQLDEERNEYANSINRK